MTIEIIKGHDNQVANFFSSPSNTPETDEKVSVGLENADRECVPAEFARKLERERDESREAFVIATDQMVQAQCQVRETRVTIEDAKRALKATAYEGILLAAMRVKEERDEAREALKISIEAFREIQAATWKTAGELRGLARKGLDKVKLKEVAK